jgi:hypothetical protein
MLDLQCLCSTNTPMWVNSVMSVNADLRKDGHNQQSTASRSQLQYTLAQPTHNMVLMVTIARVLEVKFTIFL